MEQEKRNTVVSYQANMPKAPVETAWGWDTEAQNAVLGDKDNPDWKRYRRAHLYFYEDKKETKAGYKLPIAKMVDGQLKVVFRGVVAAMAALNGAREGVDLPAGAKEKVYRVIVKYYKSFDKVAPALRSEEELAKDPIAKYGSLKKAYEALPKKTQTALTNKAKEHNEKVKSAASKRTTKFKLAGVYWRGIGAYKTNPQSVRPNVTSAAQWAMARVNSFLYALRNGKFKGGKHDLDFLPKSHPLASSSSRAEEVTNFPKRGDNKKVSMRNSNWQTFPIGYAMKLKEEYPEIWKKGGNTKGNAQFRSLTPVVQRGGTVETKSEEDAVRLREAWVARHYKDFRIAGVIAQVKWFAVGSRGLSYMKNLINEEKKKIDDRKKKSKLDEKLLVRSVDCEVKDNGEKHYTLQLKERAYLPVALSQYEEYGKDEGEYKANEDFYMVKGVASSTSVDSYGTEMSYGALMDMAKQMQSGVPILPAHNSFAEGGFAEWDEVIGRTYDAEVMRAKVVDPAEPMEMQYALVLYSKLYKDEEKAIKLAKRLERQEPIGQSIGGWFDSVRAIENNSGQVERVIVDRVVLDHVAITRAPANPDSQGIITLSKLSVISEIEKYKDTLMKERTDLVNDAPMELGDEEIVSEIVDEVQDFTDEVNDENTEEFVVEEEVQVAELDTSDAPDELVWENKFTEEVEINTNELIVDVEKQTVSDDLDGQEYKETVPVDNTVQEQSLSKQNVDNNNKIVDNKQNSNQFDERSAINTTSSQEINMTPEQLEEMIAKAVARAVTEIQTNTKVEETVVEAKSEDSNQELITRLERAEAMVNKLLEEPVRNGRHSNAHERQHLTRNGAMAELCKFARSNGETALPTFIENNLDRINDKDIGSMKLHDLKDLLAAGLRAAEADGYFNN